MVWRLLLAALVAGSVALGGGLFLAACSGAGAKVEGEVGGVKFTLVVNDQGETVAELTGALPPGLCLEIKFIGADGNVISTVKTGVPGYVPVPSGTVGHAYDVVDCRESAAAPSKLGHQVASTATHELVYAPVVPDFAGFNPFANTMAAVRMDLPAGVDPFDSLLALVEAGPGAPGTEDVEVDFFGRMVPGTTGARLIVADNEPIVDLHLDWNGVEDYATLGSANVTQYSAGNGWSVVQALIPLSDFALGGTTWNGGAVEVQSAGDTQPHKAVLAIETNTP